MYINNLMIHIKDRNPQDILRVRRLLLSMKGHIDVLQNIRVETNIRESASACDLLLITSFADEAAFHIYIDHPLHQNVSAEMAPMVERVTSLAYRTEDA